MNNFFIVWDLKKSITNEKKKRKNSSEDKFRSNSLKTLKYFNSKLDIKSSLSGHSIPCHFLVLACVYITKTFISHRSLLKNQAHNFKMETIQDVIAKYNFTSISPVVCYEQALCIIIISTFNFQSGFQVL